MFNRKPWSYGRDIKDREYLKVSQPFEAFVDEFATALCEVSEKHIRFRVEPSDGKYTGADTLLKRLRCRRASWTVPLDRILLDKFFNGLMGIRAQYCLSPYHGSAMNALLISALRRRLLEPARAVDPSVDVKLVELSIDAMSAKTWISERDLKGQNMIRASAHQICESLGFTRHGYSFRVEFEDVERENNSVHSAARKPGAGDA